MRARVRSLAFSGAWHVATACGVLSSPSLRCDNKFWAEEKASEEGAGQDEAVLAARGTRGTETRPEATPTVGSCTGLPPPMDRRHTTLPVGRSPPASHYCQATDSKAFESRRGTAGVARFNLSDNLLLVR